MKSTFAGMRIAGILFFSFLTCSHLTAGSHDNFLTRERAAILIRSQHELLNDNFFAADSLERAYQQAFPDCPFVYLLRSARMLAEISYQEEELYKAQLPNTLDSLKIIADSLKQNADTVTSSWMHLLSGHALTYRALWLSRQGSLWGAMRNAMAGKKEYEQGLKLNPGNYDHYMALGSYHYWKSAKAGVLRWLGFFSNDKEKGITELGKAIDSSLISTDAARAALLWIYLDAKQYDSVVAIARSFTNRFPEGTSFLWPLAQAYYQKRDYQSALLVYQQVRTRLAEQPGNFKNLIECDFYTVKCLELLERKRDAIGAARNFIAYEASLPHSTKSKHQEKVAYLRSVAQQIAQLNSARRELRPN